MRILLVHHKGESISVSVRYSSESCDGLEREQKREKLDKLVIVIVIWLLSTKEGVALGTCVNCVNLASQFISCNLRCSEEKSAEQ